MLGQLKATCEESGDLYCDDFYCEESRVGGTIQGLGEQQPDTVCGRDNGRRQLLEHVKSFYFVNKNKDLTEPQLKAIVGRLLSHHRPGIIRPDKTNKGKKKKSVGEASAYSKVETKKYAKKHNKITNKKHNKKRKAASDAKNRAIIVSQGLKHTMRNEAETKLLRAHLLSIKKYPILGNLAMRQAIEGNSLLRDLHRDYSAGTQRRGPALVDQTRSSRPRPESQPLWSCCMAGLAVNPVQVFRAAPCTGIFCVFGPVLSSSPHGP